MQLLFFQKRLHTDKGKPVARQGRKAVSLPFEDSLVAESDRVSRPTNSEWYALPQQFVSLTFDHSQETKETS